VNACGELVGTDSLLKLFSKLFLWKLQGCGGFLKKQHSSKGKDNIVFTPLEIKEF